MKLSDIKTNPLGAQVPEHPRVRGLATGRIGRIVGWYWPGRVATVRWDDNEPGRVGVQRVGINNLELIEEAS